MTVSQEDSNNREEQSAGSGKKYPISAGTAAFLIFSFLLILGFCRFSFYVLKNHRSAIDRDTLVKTYVDVQPYSGARKEKSAYIVLRNQDKAAPAPFFVNDTPAAGPREITPQKRDSTAPQPVLAKAQTKPAALPPMAKTVKRPPVIRTAAVAPAVAIPEKEIKTEDKKQEGVSLDNLMNSGLTLLTESDEAVIASEFLLQEDDLKPAEKEKETLKLKDASETVATKPAAEHEQAKPKTPVKKQAAKKKTAPETRWVDIAQLRRQLSELKEKEEIRRKNAALLEMNNARQTASLNTKTATDAADGQTSAGAAAVSTTADIRNTPDSSAKPQDLTAAAGKTKTAEETVQTAVVQDVPFAGTAEPPQQTTGVKQTAAAFLAGDSPSLWKIAKARGKPKNTLAAKEEEETPEAMEKPAENIVAAAAEPKQERPTVIYKNGKVSAVVSNQPQKSLNWLDRQEAAVWTSMSQSDTPSVWSAAADAQTAATDRAKAFRVADEQPAPSGNTAESSSQNTESNIINSLPVRIVGEEQKPEAKVNPLLLPLGAPTPVSAGGPAAAVPAAAPVIPTGLPPKVNPGGLSEALLPAAQANTEKAKQNEEESGLVDKLFSFFGKTDTGTSLPSVGSGTAPAVQPEKEKDKSAANGAKSKTAVKKSSQSAEQQQTKQSERQIVPTELRLTFKPDSSEMSAQSVKWIKAFGQRAKKDIQNAVEVRMSNIDPDLQEKRFALIRSTLTGVGMEDVQIIPVITDRTPHTIVLRMIVLPEEGYTEYTSENGGIQERLYYRKW